MHLIWIVTALFVAAGLILVFLRIRREPEVPIHEARKLFSQQREHLEAKFFELAAASGKPRGLRWKDCEWESPVEFARERESGKLAALVGITLAFEAIEGGEMEGVAAVGNLRNASAVFFFHQGRWYTTGKAVFNLNPDEVIQRFSKQYERLETN